MVVLVHHNIQQEVRTEKNESLTCIHVGITLRCNKVPQDTGQSECTALQDSCCVRNRMDILSPTRVQIVCYTLYNTGVFICRALQCQAPATLKRENSTQNDSKVYPANFNVLALMQTPQISRARRQAGGSRLFLDYAKSASAR